MISGTITDASGRTLIGPDDRGLLELGAPRPAAHHRPELRARRRARCGPTSQELARIGRHSTSACYPNAGLPNPLSPTGFDETPETPRRILREFAATGCVNIVGGCCGTTPGHIARHRARRRGDVPPRASRSSRARAAALRPRAAQHHRRHRTFVERRRAHQRHRLRRRSQGSILDGRLSPRRSSVARQQVEAGAQIIDINMDEGMLDWTGGDDRAS
jgi:5-methyltetrahydrofolate--homocysteine methyltransferase